MQSPKHGHICGFIFHILRFISLHLLAGMASRLGGLVGLANLFGIPLHGKVCFIHCGFLWLGFTRFERLRLLMLDAA